VQLSVALALTAGRKSGTAPVQAPFVLIGFGVGTLAIAGGVVSATVTWNVHLEVFPAWSVATQLTTVTPDLKLKSGGGEQSIVVSGQLSVTVGGVYFGPVPSRHCMLTLVSGQSIVGACVSLIVTTKEQVAGSVVAAGLGLVAVQVTVVVPTGKNVPEEGVQFTGPQLLAVGTG
jgi:hypothetical protein